jgi:hypothetical protein
MNVKVIKHMKTVYYYIFFLLLLLFCVLGVFNNYSFSLFPLSFDYSSLANSFISFHNCTFANITAKVNFQSFLCFPLGVYRFALVSTVFNNVTISSSVACSLLYLCCTIFYYEVFNNSFSNITSVSPIVYLSSQPSEYSFALNTFTNIISKNYTGVFIY